MVDFTLLFFFLVGTYVGAKDVRDIILKPLYNDVSMQVSKKGNWLCPYLISWMI